MVCTSARRAAAQYAKVMIVVNDDMLVLSQVYWRFTVAFALADRISIESFVDPLPRSG